MGMLEELERLEDIKGYASRTARQLLNRSNVKVKGGQWFQNNLDDQEYLADEIMLHEYDDKELVVFSIVDGQKISSFIYHGKIAWEEDEEGNDY